MWWRSACRPPILVADPAAPAAPCKAPASERRGSTQQHAPPAPETLLQPTEGHPTRQPAAAAARIVLASFARPTRSPMRSPGLLTHAGVLQRPPPRADPLVARPVASVPRPPASR